MPTEASACAVAEASACCPLGPELASCRAEHGSASHSDEKVVRATQRGLQLTALTYEDASAVLPVFSAFWRPCWRALGSGPGGMDCSKLR